MRFICTADWHLRATRPRCRIDENWIETQMLALSQLVKISREKDAPIIVVGDLFHSNSDTSFECISMVQKLADVLGELYILAGNHDLPYHSSENIDKSAIGILLKSKNIKRIDDYFDFNGSFDISASNFDEKDNKNAEIVFKHVLTIPEEEKPSFVDCETPESLLEKFPNAKWIFTGDYHRNFHYEKKGRHVVNSGCLIRQVSDFKDYQCGVYFVNTDTDIVEFIPIIDNEELIDDSYIIKENEREQRIDNFVNKLQKTQSISFDFIDNVKKSMKENEFTKDLENMVNELMEV
jgi:DNA repair exonuclease SbcCD nuclease subunit